ncbi:hypothetical protein CSN47_24045 [Salmonella enterica subsp. enterica serovar Dublin]|nr:hypothetical protein [Salmonella enterica subsp. enterica serovar Dublin]
MKQVKFRLDDDEYELAKVNAAVCGVHSVNVFAKRKVLEVETTPLSIHVSDKPAKAVFTYLYPHEIEILKRNAALHGMSMSREIAIRVRQSLLKNEVCLYPDEIKDLKKLTTAIDRIGRNIHFIIKGERFCTVNDPDFRKEVVEVIGLCQSIDSALETLTKSVVNRFG